MTPSAAPSTGKSSAFNTPSTTHGVNSIESSPSWVLTSPVNRLLETNIRGAEIDDRDAQDRDGDEEDEEGGADVDDDDEGDDANRLSVNPEKLRNVSEKRLRDDAAFRTWFERNQREVAQSSVANAAVPIVSPGSSLGQSGMNKKIIMTPREYQVDLFERAREKNTIVVLDTGSGKTLIAALLLRHTLDQELEHRALGRPRKTAFFLVEKVALCIQQHAVLSCNLEHSVGKFYGDIAGIMRTKEYWDEQFEESMVIVSTAQVLLDCLSSGFIKMSQINLLVFDEAHHTKKSHPYAKIIKGHYLREQNDRPRILGMTASPVDAHTRDVQASAAELESILCSEIATVSDEVLIANHAKKQQTEVREYYGVLESPEDARTQLWAKIAESVAQNLQFRPHLDFTQDAASTLGPWCADRYWQLLLTDAEVSKLEARTDRDCERYFGPSIGDQATASVREVQTLVKGHKFKAPVKDSLRLSTKVNSLRQVLEDAFCRQETKRCIVFVQKRYTAFLLTDAFHQPELEVPGMKASFMVGTKALSSTMANMSIREQSIALNKFRAGETSCLFATQVAEEGIDIPECDLIIRFDIHDSAIQYIQSKGRARQNKSTYVNMMEMGNMHHLRRLKQTTREAFALRQFCSALPADRKVQDIVIDVEAVAKYEDMVQKSYEVEATGARLTFASSLEVLAKFVWSLPHPHDSYETAEYVVTSTGKKFVANIVFPDVSPIKTMMGHPQRNKQLAKCSAAFEVCVELVKKKYINGHLQPTFTKRLPAMRSARLALTSSQNTAYTMRIQSESWSHLGDAPPAELFAATIFLEDPGVIGRPTASFILLTRFSLPKMYPIPLFFGNGRSTTALLTAASTPLKLDLGQVRSLTTFTLKIFVDVFSKEYDASSQDLPYFFAPCAAYDATAVVPDLRIDWDLLTDIGQRDYLEWKNAPEDFFHDKFVVDPWDGSRKLVIHGINKGLKPSDPTPKDAPEPRCAAYRLGERTIKEYSSSLFRNSRQKVQWKEDQPVVNAEVLSLRRNFLDESYMAETSSMQCCVILEPLKVSSLPVECAYMAMILPIIFYRIDSVLIALEACSILELPINPDLALEAMTKNSDNTEEHGEEKMQFQPGMGKNYERLEFLGDAFLKMATTISLFTLIPDTNEYEYHVERMLLICNQNLFNHAVDRKLYEYIRSKSFDRRTWYPDLKLKRGKASKKKLQHHLGDKSVADVCEALIGAAYLSGPDGDMDMAVKAVTMMVKSKNHRMTSFVEYFAEFKVPAWQMEHSTAAQRHAVGKVAEATGYTFQSPPLLRSVFKHPSYPYESIPNYQRLEFLGDALLDLAIIDYLFKRFPAADPQWLTEHKMAMASNHFLGSLCVQLNLHKHILSSQSSILGLVSGYVAELEQAKEAAFHEAEREGRPMRKDFWLKTSLPPKGLADVLEAFVGAMFVDSKYDYSTVQQFFNVHVVPYFEDMGRYDTFSSKHPVTALTHRMQEELACSAWRICTTLVPSAVDTGADALKENDAVSAFMVHGKVIAHATAKTGRDAKVGAAKQGLKLFAEMGVETFRDRMGCDCKVTTEQGRQEQQEAKI